MSLVNEIADIIEDWIDGADTDPMALAKMSAEDHNTGAIEDEINDMALIQTLRKFIVLVHKLAAEYDLASSYHTIVSTELEDVDPDLVRQWHMGNRILDSEALIKYYNQRKKVMFNLASSTEKMIVLLKSYTSMLE